MNLDCAFLLADIQMEQTFKGFFGKEKFHLSLKTRPFTYKIIRDSQGKDPGVYKKGHELLQPLYGECQHAIAVLDNEWEGSPGPEVIQRNMKKKLVQNGWREENVEIIVIEPELEVWLWQDAPYMADVLHFNHQPHDSLRQWLEARGFWHSADSKPARPKEAFEAIQRATKRPFSGATCGTIAQKISIRRCEDTAFCLLRDTLQRWFPDGGGQQ